MFVYAPVCADTATCAKFFLKGRWKNANVRGEGAAVR